MKKKILLTVLIVSLLLNGVATMVFGADIFENIRVLKGVRLEIDYKEVVPRDANGIITEPFVYEGTTYVPVRFVSQYLGYDVTWNQQTKTVGLYSKQNQDNNAIGQYKTYYNSKSVSNIGSFKHDGQVFIDLMRLNEEVGGPLKYYESDRILYTGLKPNATKDPQNDIRLFLKGKEYWSYNFAADDYWPYFDKGDNRIYCPIEIASYILNLKYGVNHNQYEVYFSN